MAILAEYAITPDVFDADLYTDQSVADIRLQYFKEALLAEALVRDLRGGEWREVFRPGSPRRWHKRGLELFKKLVQQNRLASAPAALATAPTCDADWCAEAVASHRQRKLDGIISTGTAPDGVPVAPLDRLGTAAWWNERSCTQRLARTTTAYLEHLGLLLRTAKSLMFVDPHLDPSRPGYQNFVDLVVAAGNRALAPAVEIHRVCYRGSHAARTIVPNDEWEQIFRAGLEPSLVSAGLKATVFVWDDFHDRYLISNLVGILMPNGFDVSGATAAQTTWARMGRPERDDVQREFDEASQRHTLRTKFTLG